MSKLDRFSVLVCGLILAAYAFRADSAAPDLTELLAKAKGGDAQSQFDLAAAYDSGRGTARNGQEAMKWYRAAAEQGHAEAQNSVGSGLQAEKRYADALPWYEKASAQGHALATNNLAYLYDLGLGVRQDRSRAFALYGKAADLGWPEAMWNVANMYGAGQVGKKDLLMACVWAVRAKRFAGPEDQELSAHLSRVMPQLERMLSTAQFSSCKQQGESWSPAGAVNAEQR